MDPILSLKVLCVLYTWTDQPTSFPEVTKETAMQREGQLIALAQLYAFVAVASYDVVHTSINCRMQPLAHLTFQAPVW